jgi:hypothetical protein
MVSYRKKPIGMEGPGKDGPPISAPPREQHPRQAETPPAADVAKPADVPKLPEQLATEPNPGEQAAQNAIKQRLAETEHAAELQREDRPQYAEAGPQQPPTADEIIANTQLPERAKRWLRQHPDYVTDPAKNGTLIALHPVAARQAGSEWTDTYFDKMDDLLGFRPPQRQANRSEGQQVRQQPYRGPQISAPPSREVPSPSTGRPQSYRAPLTKAEVEIAQASGITDAEYQTQKERMLRLQERGVI